MSEIDWKFVAFDALTLSELVKKRPATDAIGEHELTSVRVPGKRERDVPCKIPRMRMVREQQRPRARIATREQCRRAVPHSVGAVIPRQPEKLHTLTANNCRRSFAEQKRQAAAFRFATKSARILDEIVIPLARRDDVPRAERPHDVERRREIAQRVVDEIDRKSVV